MCFFFVVFFFFFFSTRERSSTARVMYIRVSPLHIFKTNRGVADTVEIGTTAETKEGFYKLTFQSYVYFYYMYSLVHYCVHPMHDYSSFGTRLAHSSPRQSRIFILHFLCLVATTSLTRSSSLVPSWPTPCLKNRNRRF